VPDRPAAMRTNGRPPDPAFEAGEVFYHRVNPGWVQPDGKVDPAHVQCPGLSSNRSKYSESFYVLFPRAKYEGYAVFKFRQDGPPPTISSPNTGGGTPTVYDVRTVHDPLSFPPEEDNYGHCETRVFRCGSSEPLKASVINSGAKKVFRVKMSFALELDREPGVPF
jgi:hypothetical protein